MSIYSQIAALKSDQGIAGQLAHRIIQVLDEVKAGTLHPVKGQWKIRKMVLRYADEQYANKEELHTHVAALTNYHADLSSI